MDSDRKISPAVINRLPRYYRYLGDLLESDITRISSKELSAKMNITASQIRQDLIILAVLVSRATDITLSISTMKSKRS